MKIWTEFKEFAVKGNVIDLAVAVIIGAAFGKIVTSLVEDVITPLLLNPAMEAAGVQHVADLTWGTVKYGNFLSAIINFLFIAVVLFIMIKVMNSLKSPGEEQVVTGPTKEEELLTEIRDLLKNR